MQLTTANKLICTGVEYEWARNERMKIVTALVSSSDFLADCGLTDQANAFIDALNDIIIVEEEPNHAE